MKILAVDDDELILAVLSEAMSVGGHSDVTTATSAEEACRVIAAAREPFDCFLLDIQMPEVTGIELCRQIRRMPGYATTPIIMVTAMSDRQYVNAAFAAGATDYVTKPFDALELGSRIGMAERLVQETWRANESNYAATVLRQELEDQRRVVFSEPINIEGVDGVIGLLNLENYLLQLSRGGLFATNIFAVKMSNAEKLYARCTPSDFRFLLTDVAEAIASALSAHEFFVAYAGAGVFVCALHGRELEEKEVFQKSANAALEDMSLTDSRGVAHDVSLHFGDPIRVGMLRSGSAAVEALYVAIERIEDECRAESTRKTGQRAPWLKLLVG